MFNREKNDFMDQDLQHSAKNGLYNDGHDFSYYDINAKKPGTEKGGASSPEGGSEHTNKSNPIWAKIKEYWKYVRPAAIILISALILYIAISAGISYITSNFFSPVSAAQTEAIEVVIKKGSSVSSIAKLLEEKGLIRNSTVFKFYVDFTDSTSKIRAGTYRLSKSMTLDEMIDVMKKGDGDKATVRFTVVEGLTIDQIAAQLVKNGILASSKKFIELANDLKTFDNYWFLSELTIDEKRPRHYNLEGYLFPDTYEIYIGATEEDIINKMLVRFAGIWQESYSALAQDLGLSLDEVITMASMIQAEAKGDDFTKVSAVFHNRLKAKMLLGSDATVLYALGLDELTVTAEQMSVDSPYNTYKYKGLPVGAICNPSQAAIEAVLHPDEETMKEGYYYFCLTDPKTGVLAFSKTLEEHKALVEKYSPLW
ncbi:MAG: endolytic transglycosylase MltG [Christensenellales bacterium]